MPSGGELFPKPIWTGVKIVAIVAILHGVMDMIYNNDPLLYCVGVPVGCGLLLAGLSRLRAKK